MEQQDGQIYDTPMNPTVAIVRHPHCVLYNSKGLGMLTLTVEHSYI